MQLGLSVNLIPFEQWKEVLSISLKNKIRNKIICELKETEHKNKQIENSERIVWKMSLKLAGYTLLFMFVVLKTFTFQYKWHKSSVHFCMKRRNFFNISSLKKYSYSSKYKLLLKYTYY